MTAAGAEEVFGGKRSGLDETRPELEKALEFAHEGDVFVVTKVDRLARSAARLYQIVKDARRRVWVLRCWMMPRWTRPRGQASWCGGQQIGSFVPDCFVNCTPTRGRSDLIYF
ncbi:recombinase family protein [Mesorhizobium huakuii]|uniref:recombinase family protein n=1 Tax=Mesorhizobium huakuii TaxID=28104 RepID=UPI0024E11F19|nr:recombinase family protein [Mesorhizobium huakuii]